MSADAISGARAATDDAAPTTELLTGVVGDRCPNCHSAMAADQRYCLNCGERRGRARFSPETFTATTTTVAAAPPLPPPRSRFSPGSTIVAGVATLLIALGVGVLIGSLANNNNNSGRTPAAQIVTVGGGAAASTTASTTPITPTKKAASAKAAKKAKRTVVHITAKTAKAATAAAAKVLGSSKNLSKNVQQQIGGSCSGGAGCQNGKFTGNFFPNG